jgi:hypothetical protein
MDAERYKSPGSVGLAHSMDRYVYTICRYLASAEARAMSLNSQDCGSREITP